VVGSTDGVVVPGAAGKAGVLPAWAQAAMGKAMNIMVRMRVNLLVIELVETP
jgi:hypothetical protein